MFNIEATCNTVKDSSCIARSSTLTTNACVCVSLSIYFYPLLHLAYRKMKPGWSSIYDPIPSQNISETGKTVHFSKYILKIKRLIIWKWALWLKYNHNFMPVWVFLLFLPGTKIANSCSGFGLTYDLVYNDPYMQSYWSVNKTSTINVQPVFL